MTTTNNTLFADAHWARLGMFLGHPNWGVFYMRMQADCEYRYGESTPEYDFFIYLLKEIYGDVITAHKPALKI